MTIKILQLILKWVQSDNASWNTVKNNNSYNDWYTKHMYLPIPTSNRISFSYVSFVVWLLSSIVSMTGFHTIRITEKESVLLYILLSWLQVYDGKDDCLHVSYTKWCDCSRVIFHKGQLGEDAIATHKADYFGIQHSSWNNSSIVRRSWLLYCLLVFLTFADINLPSCFDNVRQQPAHQHLSNSHVSSMDKTCTWRAEIDLGVSMCIGRWRLWSLVLRVLKQVIRFWNARLKHLQSAFVLSLIVLTKYVLLQDTLGLYLMHIISWIAYLYYSSNAKWVKSCKLHPFP